MGFDEKKIIQFDEPKTFAYKANVDDLKKYTLKLLIDDSLREKLGKNAREHAVKNFDYKVTSKKMLDVIKEKFDFLD